MKTTREVFKDVLDELGFSGHKPSQMTNRDYWLCTTTAMERFASIKNKNRKLKKVVLEIIILFLGGFSSGVLFILLLKIFK